MTDVRFASTNVRDAQTADGLAKAVRKVRSQLPDKPNVWAGQEWNGASPQKIKNVLGPNWAVAFDDHIAGSTNGTAMAWDTNDFKMVDKGTGMIYDPPEDGPFEKYNGQLKKDWKRFATWVTLKGGSVFSVASFHGKLGPDGKGKQWDNFVEILAMLELRGPVLVAGDANDTTRGPLGKAMRSAGYKLVVSAHIDSMWVKDMKKVKTVVLAKDKLAPVMDHPALYAELVIKDEPQTPGLTARVLGSNLLGASHTDPKNGEHYAKQYKTWDQRLPKHIKYMQSSKATVYGLTECQPPQLGALKKAYAGWAWVTGRPNKDNVIGWDTSVWTLVEELELEILYFHGKAIFIPIVLLSHNVTGQSAYFMLVHNPASTKGDAAKLRREDERREADFVRDLQKKHPVVVIGDFNDNQRFIAHWRSMLPHWKVAGKAIVDWIVVSRAWTVKVKKVDVRPKVTKTSDHPIVYTVLKLEAQ